MPQNLSVLTITIILLLVSLHSEFVHEPFQNCNDLSDNMTFYYFAYGSNLLAKRIHINNPTALRVDIGRLDNYRLDFVGHSDKWHGAVATVVPNDNRTVWGAIWRIEMKDMTHLDKQEGVAEGIYRVLEHCIVRKNGSTLLCRMYQHCLIPEDVGKIKQLPQERMPSATYVDTMREGGKESDLPNEYLKFLFTIPDNGNTTSLNNFTNDICGELTECA